MFKDILNQLKIAFTLFIFLSLLTGIIYPVTLTAIAQLLFPWQANGSLITQNNKLLGSQLIGQSFTFKRYFWGRPSATTPYPYNGESSSGSNMGPSNPAFWALVDERVNRLHHIDLENNQLIPVDLVTASGSGLDSEISPLAAFYQVSRIARVRHIAEKDIHQLINKYTKKPTFGILGEPRVNVLLLNLALDNLKSGSL